MGFVLTEKKKIHKNFTLPSNLMFVPWDSIGSGGSKRRLYPSTFPSYQPPLHFSLDDQISFKVIRSPQSMISRFGSSRPISGSELTARSLLGTLSVPSPLELSLSTINKQEAILKNWALATLRFRGTINSHVRCKSNIEWPQNAHQNFEGNISHKAYHPGSQGSIEPRSLTLLTFQIKSYWF